MRPDTTPEGRAWEGGDAPSLLAKLPAALAWLKQQWLVMARLMSVLVGGKPADEDGRRSMTGVIRALVAEQMRHLAALDLQTNDLVRLRCRPGPKGRRSWTLQVNGRQPLGLNLKEAFIMNALADAAVRAGTDEKAGDGFVAFDSMKVGQFDLMKARGLPVAYLTYKEVRQTVARLRAKLPALDSLIETRRGRGYRLSTAWFNVAIDSPSRDTTATSRRTDGRCTP